MTGPVLIGTTESYLDGLKNGAVPTVSSAWQGYKRNVIMEAELGCSNAVESMEKRLRAACYSSDANIDNVVKVLGTLVFEYEASYHGPEKQRKLAMFLQQSLEGPIFDLAKRLIDQTSDWKGKYDQVLTKQRAKEDQVSSDFEVLMSWSTAAEARLAAR